MLRFYQKLLKKIIYFFFQIYEMMKLEYLSVKFYIYIKHLSKKGKEYLSVKELRKYCFPFTKRLRLIIKILYS